MSKTTRAMFVDDLDGSIPARRVVFALDEKIYYIDLSAENEAGLREIFAPHLPRARMAKKGMVLAVRTAQHETSYSVPYSKRHDSFVVRRWLLARGHEVPRKGRLSSRWFDLYDAQIAEMTQEQSLVTPEGGSNVLPTP